MLQKLLEKTQINAYDSLPRQFKISLKVPRLISYLDYYQLKIKSKFLP